MAGSHFFCNLRPISVAVALRRDARVVEEARLESVYTPKGYRGFESPSLRRKRKERRMLDMNEKLNKYYIKLSINLKN